MAAGFSHEILKNYVESAHNVKWETVLEELNTKHSTQHNEYLKVQMYRRALAQHMNIKDNNVVRSSEQKMKSNQKDSNKKADYEGFDNKEIWFPEEKVPKTKTNKVDLFHGKKIAFFWNADIKWYQLYSTGHYDPFYLSEESFKFLESHLDCFDKSRGEPRWIQGKILNVIPATKGSLKFISSQDRSYMISVEFPLRSNYIEW